jgi:hypothetical protein
MHESSRRDGRSAGLPQAAPGASDSNGIGRDPSVAATSRRRFLFALGASSAAALGTQAPAAAAAVGASTQAPARADGYRETDHVRRYYDSARH